MKKLIQLLTLTAVATLFALPAFAQTASSTPAQGSEEERTKLYQTVIDNRKEHPEIACPAGRDYISKYGSANDEYVAYVKKYVAACDKADQQLKAAQTNQNFNKLVKDGKFDEAFVLGQQILQTSPDDLTILINSSWSAYNLVRKDNHAHDAEAAPIAQKAIAAIQAGKTLEAGKPLEGKNEILGWLNYELALINLNSKSDVDAAGYFIKAAQIEGDYKKSPITYGQLASVYEGQYAKLQADYKTRFEGQPETPESKAAFEQVKQFLDPLIDAYARAVAYSGTDAKFAQNKAAWNTRLKQLYEFRNGSATGVEALIAGVQAKPIPAQPSIAPLPATPAPTPTTDGGAPATGATPSATPAAATAETPVQADTSMTPATNAAPAQAGKPATPPAKTMTPSTVKPATQAGKAPSTKPRSK